jgi:hypothetical protein
VCMSVSEHSTGSPLHRRGECAHHLSTAQGALYTGQERRACTPSEHSTGSPLHRTGEERRACTPSEHSTGSPLHRGGEESMHTI